MKASEIQPAVDKWDLNVALTVYICCWKMENGQTFTASDRSLITTYRIQHSSSKPRNNMTKHRLIHYSDHIRVAKKNNPKGIDV